MLTRRDCLNLGLTGLVTFLAFGSDSCFKKKEDIAVKDTPRNSSCNPEIRPGRTSYEAHIIYYNHADTDTGKVSFETLLSQLQEYRLLNQLYSNGGLSAIFVEGLPLGHPFTTLYPPTEIKETLRAYQDLRRKKNDEEQKILAHFILNNIPIGYLLMGQRVPVVGYEDQEKLTQAKEIAKKYFGSSSTSKDKEEFSLYVDFRRSVQAMELVRKAPNILRNPPRIALIIGKGHKESIEFYLNEVPIREPTLYFHDTTECHDLVSLTETELLRLTK